MQFHRPAPHQRLPEPSGDQVSSSKVTKKLLSGSTGARMLKDRFGEALVCFRHRITPDSKNRSPALELLVGHIPVRCGESTVIGVQSTLGESELQVLVRAAGASWNPSSQFRKMPLLIAEAVGLKKRVCKLQK